MWNDRRLARRAARGDADAFAAIFRRYQQDLYRYCVAILGNPQDAQDALQNTMVKALRTLPGEDRQIELKPWLYRVAHNESIELRRRARPSEPLAEDLGSPIASLEETAAERGRLRDLLADIGELSERHRGALVMRELGGLDFDQIGKALDTSPGAARQVLYEARRSLQQMSDGREMNCDAVTALLSDGDGRVARRRDVRAHLRDCSECRGFADGIRDRSATLAGIAPLPAIAAAAIAKGALAGGGGAATGAGGAGAAGGATGLAGGAAKLASTGAILKSTAAIVAVVGVSAVAVDHGRLFHGGSPHHDARSRPAAVAGSGSEAGAPGATSSRRAPERDGSTYVKTAGPVDIGVSQRVRGEAASVASRRSAAAPSAEATSAKTTRPSSPATGTDEPPARSDAPSQPTPSPAQPTRSEQPAHQAQPEHPVHPTHPAHPTHPSEPVHPTHPAHPTHPPHPAHPSEPARSSRPTKAEPKPDAEPESAPEEVDAHEAPPEAAPSDDTSEAEAADPEEAEAKAHPTPPSEPPGQAKK